MSWPDLSEIKGISVHQREELSCAFEARIGALCGCPGAGKTFTTAAVIRHILGQYGPALVNVCAPTGKAAIRATRSLRANQVNVRATTIHSLLGCSFNSSGAMEFVHNSSNRLTAKYYFIDEASWIGNFLGSSLLNAIPDDSYILFVGDHHQLPPVERGAVLRDMMTAGVPYGDLTEIHRNGGQIVASCKTIREGGGYVPSEVPRFGHEYDNLCHIESFDNAMSLAKVDQLTKVMMTECADTIDIKWDLQILCYMNEGTQASRKELNQFMQERVNPNGQKLTERFRVGDKVICLSNNSYHWQIGSDKQTKFVANGQLGEIMGQDGKYFVIKLESDGFDDDMVFVDHSKLTHDWDLGYAISIHKSQGSSWPIVFLVVDESSRARFLGSRQIIYTGISRAEKYCVTIGKKATINHDLRRDAISDRSTRLVERLTERIFDDEGNPIWRKV